MGEFSIDVMIRPPVAGIFIRKPSFKDLILIFSLGKLKEIPSPDERSSNPLPHQKSDITGLVLNLFPNPASTEMIVSAALDQSKESPVWSVFDATGRMVLMGQTTSENLRSGLNINLENITSGIYFFKLNTTTELITKRFIVNR